MRIKLVQLLTVLAFLVVAGAASVVTCNSNKQLHAPAF